MKVFKNKQRKLENSQDSIIQSLSPGKQLLISTVAKKNSCDGNGFFAITALDDATIDVSECDTGILENVSGAIIDATTDIVIPAGVTIYGNFSEIELLTGSGAVIAYARTNAVLTGEA